MNVYLEQSVAGRRTARGAALYALCWALIVLLIAAAVAFAAGILRAAEGALRINWAGAAGLVLCLAAAVAVFLRKDYLRVEYDYILRDGELDVIAILNNRRRRPLAQISLERIARMGPASGADYEAARRQPGLKPCAWHVREDGLTYLCYMEQSVRRMALLELNAEMIAAIRGGGALPAGAWRGGEGKTQ